MKLRTAKKVVNACGYPYRHRHFKRAVRRIQQAGISLGRTKAFREALDGIGFVEFANRQKTRDAIRKELKKGFCYG